MVAVSWKNDVSGNWSTGANWSTGTVPGATDDVTISTAHPQTITHNAGANAVASLYMSSGTLALSGGSIVVNGIATMYAALKQSAGTLRLAGGNSVLSGTVAQTAGTLAITSGTLALDGVGNTFAGTITGNAVDFDSGSDTLQAGLVFSVKHVFQSGANLTLGADLSQVGSWMQTSGTLALGGHTLALSGPTSFDGGSVSGTGTIALSGTSEISSYYTVGSVVLQNSGVVNQTGYFYIGYNGPDTARFVNQAGATYRIVNNNIYGAALGTFTNAGTFIKTGSGSSNVAASLTNTGSLAIRSGVLRLSGASNGLGGTIGGAGTLELGAGTDTIAAGTTLSVANVLLDGANVTLGGNLAYGGVWNQTAGTLALGGKQLSLNGDANLDGGVVNGAGTLALHGDTELYAYYVEGNVVINNTGLATETNYIYLGYNGTDAPTFNNQAGATLSVAANSQIYGTTGARLVNAGTLIKSGGASYSGIAISTTSTGTIEIDSGSLRLSGPNNSLKGSVGGNGTLELISGADTLGPGLSLTVGHVLLDGATVNLGANLTVAGEWSQTSGTLALGGRVLTLNGSTNLDGGVITGNGTLAAKSVEISSVALEGNMTFKNAGVITQTGLLYDGYYAADTVHIINQIGRTYEIVNNASIFGTTGSDFTNAGTFSKTGGAGISDIDVSFANTGKISVAAGTLRFSSGTNNLGGTIVGNGTVELYSGVDTLAAGLGISTSAVLLDGAKVALGGDLAYGGIWNQTAGTLALGGHLLTLSGMANLDNSVVNGSGTITLGANSEVYNYALEGSTVLVNTGVLIQSGSWYVGYNGSDTAQLVNQAGATLRMNANTDVYSTVGSNITNAGSIVKFGSGLSQINASTKSTGTIDVEGGILRFSGGTNVLGGTLAGSGTVELTSGATTLSAGTNIAANGMLLDGANVTLGGNLSDAKGWAMTSGTLSLNSHVLTLSGTASFDGGVVTGSGTLALTGATELSTFALEGTSVMTNAGSVMQAGNWYLGYNSSDTSQLVNKVGATYEIAGNGQIYGVTGAKLTNAGTLTKSGGSGNSQIGVATINTGTVNVASGSMSFAGAVSGSGAFVVGAGNSLTFAGEVASGGSVTLGTGSNLALSAAAGFGDTIAGFAGGNLIDLQGMAYNGTTSFTFNSATDKLTATNGSVTTTLQFAGNYTASSFRLFNDHGTVGIAHS